MTRGALAAIIAAIFLLSGGTPTSRADEPVMRQLVIKDHKFDPAEIHVPAKQAITIEVQNADDTAEEWESSELKIEKIIPGSRKGVVRLRPLDPGRYKFFGDFHQDTAQGVIVAE